MKKIGVIIVVVVGLVFLGVIIYKMGSVDNTTIVNNDTKQKDKKKISENKIEESEETSQPEEKKSFLDKIKEKIETRDNKSVNTSPKYAGLVVGHNNTDISKIPEKWIDKAKADLHIAYNHTSHGSQIITGMNALRDFPDFGDKYAWINDSKNNSISLNLLDQRMKGANDLSNGEKDSDKNGISDWADATGKFLNDPKNIDINVVMWSWCNIANHDITAYINNMEMLIRKFGEGGIEERAKRNPVKFVFMTAHANGQGEDDSADIANKQIREYLMKKDRILFDFSDIENYDPDGNYFLDKQLNDTLDYSTAGAGARDANWAAEYLKKHDGEILDKLTHGDDVAGYKGAESCAHSNDPDNDARLNCVLKGRAAWYLFARLAGWDGK